MRMQNLHPPHSGRIFTILSNIVIMTYDFCYVRYDLIKTCMHFGKGFFLIKIYDI